MSVGRRNLVLLAPFGLVAAGGVAFMSMLKRMDEGKFDPHAINNPLVGHPIPDFNMPGLGKRQGFSSADLRAAAAVKPILVNFYASWCVPCAAEADVVGNLSAEGITFWGVSYEDKPDASEGFLNKYGDPYTRVANDSSGRVAIDFGVYGVPETFLIGKGGVIRWHVAGPLTDDIVRAELRPALAAAA